MSYVTMCGTPGADADGCHKPYPSDLNACPKCGQLTIFNSTFPWRTQDYAYDIETYPNIFTCIVTHLTSRQQWAFEISDRINQAGEFVEFMRALRNIGARMVGFNNIGFDYPVIHAIVENPGVSVGQIYDKAMSIIKGSDRFGHIIWPKDRYVEQIDLFKIHHFDNKARGTSLKAVEIAMKMGTVEDLPFPPGTPLTDEQKDVLIAYNKHDVEATARFYARTIEQIEFREELTAKYGRDFMNHNDTKIGKDYFIMKLETECVECFYRDGTGKRHPRQTIRPSIALADVIFPYIQFEHPEFRRILEWFKNQTITGTKGVFKDVAFDVEGLTYKFGTGGLHASVESQTVHSTDDMALIDVDVSSYYPNLAIKNGLYPAHLGREFCDIYLDVFEQRKTHPKGTAANAMLKLALNGVYGDSNNKFSPFYDPAYTMAITINGQLLLCLLADQLIKTPGLRMVQCNTDGVTFQCPRQHLDHARAVCRWWESLTLLTLEEVEYRAMPIRDVNSYLAIKTDGSVKRIGKYDYEKAWHQDPSSLVVPKAANAALVDGANIREFIEAHDDPFDFMIRAKVPRSCHLQMEWPEYDVTIPVQGTTRYFVSTNGGSLIRISPPTGEPGSWKKRSGVSDAEFARVTAELQAAGPAPGVPVDSQGVPHDERIHTKNQSQHVTRRASECAGWRVTECARAADFNWSTLDREYYIQEAEKLVRPLIGT